MALENGTRIGTYEITGPLGAGGMGEVYRAKDSQLGRDVALKILPDTFAQDTQRMARFQREAQVLASLNHANIAAIYGVEESEGRRCLVLELVEGDTLADRIRSSPLPLEECLAIARQIAEALEAAHEKGIVHRDLKPANVKVTPGGDVKVLDFGLAKALEDEVLASSGEMGHSPTLTMAATQAGIVLGTAAYMSPEQARGKPVDRRADVWSFGVVLYEMLTRSQAFGGETVSDTLAEVLKIDPKMDLLPKELPPPIVDLLRRCLEKDPRQRLQSIGEARITLQTCLTSPSTVAAVAPTAAQAAGKRTGWATWAAGMALVALAAGLTGWWLGSTPSDIPPRKLAIQPVSLQVGYGQAPVISPDGSRLAYVAGGKLFIRDLDALDPREVSGADGARAPFWSPDGTSLAFGAKGKLYRVSAAGGDPTVLCELFSSRYDGGTWGDDDNLYVVPANGPMFQVSALGGDLRPVLEPVEEEETDFHTPSVLPDGKGILFISHRMEGPDTIEVLADGSRKQILRLEGDWLASAQYDPAGYLIYHRREKNPGIWAAPFSLSSLAMTGDPFLLDPEGSEPSVARDGTLLYSQGSDSQVRQLVWVDRNGQVTGAIGQPQAGIIFPELSPDGTQVLVSSDQMDSRDIWMVDVERGTRTRLTFDEGGEWIGSWYPDGKRITFTQGGGRSSFKISARAVDGTDEPTLLSKGGFAAIFRSEVPYMVYHQYGTETEIDIWYQSLEEESEPKAFLSASGNQAQSQISPQGKYLAYVSDESGRDEVYLKKFPGGEGKWQVSVNGGRFPRWSRDGKELFFDQRDPVPILMSVLVTMEPALRLGTPAEVFKPEPSSRLSLGGFARQYDVGLDGESFLFVQTVGGEDQDGGPRLILSQNWNALHQKRVR